ncbi:unnamed protein product [Gongylonema pulchrum]|uniref:Uncharacterized protein n=1 Tax=Gongylonema pulchrum TaxID=637853 RepID=A0A183ES09_9BILA|nr:unnamed protein product [Gongylonema pulchrum]
MEPEAGHGESRLGAEIGLRRRSTSISDDYSVQKTNDDATECKYIAAKNEVEDEGKEDNEKIELPSNKVQWATLEGATSKT